MGSLDGGQLLLINVDRAQVESGAKLSGRMDGFETTRELAAGPTLLDALHDTYVRKCAASSRRRISAAHSELLTLTATQ
jgi:hypothetical protein